MTTEQVFDRTCASVVEVAAGPLVAAVLSQLDGDEVDAVEAGVDQFLLRLRGELIEAVSLEVSGE